jgi:hypothetical protein
MAVNSKVAREKQPPGQSTARQSWTIFLSGTSSTFFPGDVVIIGHDLSADLPADSGFPASEGGVIYGIHQGYINFIRGGFEGDGLLVGFMFQNDKKLINVLYRIFARQVSRQTG